MEQNKTEIVETIMEIVESETSNLTDVEYLDVLKELSEYINIMISDKFDDV